MVEWRLTPEWILDNWTNEEFTLMVEKLAARKQREAEASKGDSKERAVTVSDKELFSRAGNKIKVVSGHGD